MSKIKRVSLLSNIEHEMFIFGVTQEEVDEWAYQPRGMRPLVQHMWPDLTPDEREFIKTGITPDEWPVGVGA